LQSERRVIPLDYPAAVEWLGGDEPAGELAASLSRGSHGRWRRVDGSLVLAPDEETADPLAETEWRQDYTTEIEFVDSLTAGQIAEFGSGVPRQDNLCSEAQRGLIEKARGGVMQPDAALTAGGWFVRILPQPMLHFSRRRQSAGDINLLHSIFDAFGYDRWAMCRPSAAGDLQAVDYADLLGSHKEGAWAEGPYRDSEAEPPTASEEDAVVDDTAPLRPLLVSGRRRSATSTVVTLAQLTTARDPRLVIDQRLAAKRLLLGPGEYTEAGLVAAAVAAYNLRWRVVDGTVLLTGGSPQFGRRQEEIFAKQRAMQDYAVTHWSRLLDGVEYPGLVLPWRWFKEQRRVACAALTGDLRSFVEDVWWFARQGGHGGVPTEWKNRMTASRFYAGVGAGEEGSPNRLQARSELRHVSVQCNVGFVVRRAWYGPSAFEDGITSRICSHFKVTKPELWYVIAYKEFRLYPYVPEVVP
jgi:hypothetical protein